MNKFYLLLAISISLIILSCGGKISPSIYTIDINGKEGEQLIIIYTEAIPHKEKNRQTTEQVTLPFTKHVNYWTEYKKNTYPQISCTNTTNDSVIVILIPSSAMNRYIVLDNNTVCDIKSVIQYQRYKDSYEAEYIKNITMDSLYNLLKKNNYDWIKILQPEEKTEIVLPN